MTLPWLWLLLWRQVSSWADCFILFMVMAPVLGVIALDMYAVARLRRRAFLGMYLREDSRLFRLLRGGVWMLAWQVGKALFFSFVLIIEAMHWPLWLWVVLLVDIPFLYIGYIRLSRTITQHVKPHSEHVLARQALVVINTLVMSMTLASVFFFTPHPDYRTLSWRDAAEYEALQVVVGCDALAPAARLSVAKDAVGWWLAETRLSRLRDNWTAAAGWFLFLLSTTLFLWAYSRLILGMLLRPSDLSAGSNKEPPNSALATIGDS